jgi:hypothetical protein
MGIENPTLPIKVNKGIENAYVKLSDSDTLISNFETSRQITLSGTSGGVFAYSPNVNRFSQVLGDSVSSFISSVTGSTSSYYRTVGMTLYTKGISSSFTGNTAGQQSDIGVVLLKKRAFDFGLKRGSITATATGTTIAALGGTDMSGDYYDNASGAIIQRSSGNTVGVVDYDTAMLVITSSSVREVAVSITSLKYNTRVNNTNISVFCKCDPDELNFSLNHTIFATSSLSSVETAQGYNNIYMSLPLTATTSGSMIDSRFTSSGVDFQPYITSVGLYNDDNECLAIAKLTRPIKKPTDLPITFKISVDI